MTIDTLEMECSNCGAPLLNVSDRVWKCEHCGTYTLVNFTDNKSYQGNIGDTFVHNYIKYMIITVAAHEVAVVGCDPGLSGEVILPSYVSFNNCTYTVVEISSNVFMRCNRITSLVLPAHLRTIGTFAFEYARIPDGFKIPDTVEVIGNSAFSESTNLKEISIPSSVRSIGTSAFYQCFDLESVELSEGLEQIGVMAFRRSLRLKRVSIKGVVQAEPGHAYVPKSVRNMGKYVFNLTEISRVHIWEGTVYDPRQDVPVTKESDASAEMPKSESPKTVRIDEPPKKKGLLSRLKF